MIGSSYSIWLSQTQDGSFWLANLVPYFCSPALLTTSAVWIVHQSSFLEKLRNGGHATGGGVCTASTLMNCSNQHLGAVLTKVRRRS